jgi:outer membrane protein with beta-barrel domain
LLAGVLSLAAALAPAAAQDAPPHIELAVHASSLALENSEVVGGIGGRVTIFITPRVSIDARATLFPAKNPSSFTEGGRTLELFAGGRGEFVRSRRFSIYGLLLPGLVHFSSVVDTFTDASIVTTAATHFALDMGAGIEFTPSSRWVAHAELTRPLYVVHGKELARSPLPGGAAIVFSAPASVQNSWQFDTGIGYRFGAPMSPDYGGARTAGWTVGTQIGYTVYTTAFNLDLAGTRSPTLGVFVSRGIARWVDAEGSLNGILRQEIETSAFSGGRVTQALGGVKVGTRRGRIGYFLKARAGAELHDAALKTLGATPPGRTVGRTTSIAFDLGAVVETRLGSRLLMRLDAGNLRSFYRPGSILVNGRPASQGTPKSADSINVAVGAGWRFGRQ